ncbi:MAG TPA: FprA family A-type flavoprotein [Candidatus Cloacimonadota bacterium]|jgi:flavorubredoxin|nr:FprA family A-type flavoprotein [Candidatus Cloacimonadales bacterium]HOE90660.1 FprA family A-type flavoprotein [Candidatus Cloacimonadota bacterium]HPY96626.1 FprA family A-type flavoprotein [Candidatus Cloacimonadota bacterium]HQB40947.1 FprA family A-type flavoprotein [Candidatus Cloacimonadota bacterium]
MKAIEIKKGVYWVGVIDWDLRNFHGYMTQRGSTYNAYLIIDEKITLIDNVKHYLFNEMIERIASVIDPEKIDYIVQNHIEMDHSSSLPMLLNVCPNAKIYTSPNGEKGLKLHYKKDWNYHAVKSGETLSLGKRTLTFVHTPMVHWPDNMVTYCPEEKILFSNDAFGQHIASSERFDDEYPINIILEEARKYYGNIVLPYGEQVQKALAIVGGLDFDTICNSHGIIWRKHIKEIIAEYVKWSSNEAEERAVIVYDTMWDSTKKMALAVREAFEALDIPVHMMNLQSNHISDIMTELITAKYICVGSPTLNNGILPSVSAFLTYMKGLAPKNRIGLAFGSYGWGGQAVGIVEGILKECGFELLPSFRLQYVPSGDDLNKITDSLIKEIEK